jgi:hypothetical protein
VKPATAAKPQVVINNSRTTHGKRKIREILTKNPELIIFFEK